MPDFGTTYARTSFGNPDEVENVDRYCPGGHHTTHIGAKFHMDKYVVVNKLGQGTSSTVWLTQNTLIDGEYIALNVLTAEATETTNEHIRAHLESKSNPQYPGHAYVAPPSAGSILKARMDITSTLWVRLSGVISKYASS